MVLENFSKTFKVRTLRSFTSPSREELSVEKGVILEVIGMPEDEPDWYLVRKETSEFGLIPRIILAFRVS